MTIFDNQDQDITDAGSIIGNPYGYTGRRWDAQTGLRYYRNRMYSPTLGRFMQRDPTGYVDGMNLYSYVKNNPLAYLDPWGLTANYYQIPSIPTFDYQDNFTDVAAAIDNAVINVGNDAIGIANTGLSDLQYLADYGVIDYSQAVWNNTVDTISGIGESLTNAYDYLTTTPITQQVSEASSFVIESATSLESWSQALTIGLETAAVGRIGGIGAGSQPAGFVDDVAGLSSRSGTEVVQRAMTKGELEYLQYYGTLRFGKAGTELDPHFVSNAVNADLSRAQLRLALPKTPEVRVTLEVEKGVFGPSTTVGPLDLGNGRILPGGGTERTATGVVRARILKVDEF